MISIAHLTNGAAVLGAVGVILLGGQAGKTPEIDNLTVASIVQASNADRFRAIDHARNKSCMISIHRADGYDIHRVEPVECDDMPAALATARTWQDTSFGDVRITDRKGNTILKLGPSDGFAWEVIEPAGLAMSFETD
jgi:hypothetical protein